MQDNTMLVIGLVGLGVIFSALILTAIYIYRANTRFDQLTANLRRELNG